MNEKEICFIMCTNDPKYMEEALYYINHLRIPEGYEVSFLAVEDAVSMTAGYNEGMNASGAKYKIYLHQDVFIINPDFLSDCIRLFQNNPEVGMIGMIGTPKIPESGVMWENRRYGKVCETHLYETSILGRDFEEDTEYMAVEAIDGLLMMTQYDVAWREDIFDKWDFYDASQSMEFIRKGYKVAVPNMDRAWVIHDCGFINIDRYEEERVKFVEEYL